MKRGFTLSELLIALAILGVIATFTIPKVLQNQQDSKNNAIAKEILSAIASSYHAYRLNNTVDANFKLRDLTPYLNYVKVQTTDIDTIPGSNNADCTGGNCIAFHNGAAIYYDASSFGGTGTTNAVRFYLDPDGAYSGTTTQGKAVWLWLYYTGRVSSRGTCPPGTYDSISGPHNPVPSNDPSWFSWN